jgi:hypothetical protein
MPGIMGHEWIGPEPTSNLIAGEVHHMSQPVRSKARPDRPRTRFRKITALACAFMVKEDFGTEAEGSQLRTAFARATDPQGTLRLIVTDERSLSFVDPASGKVQVLMGDGRKKYKLARERGYKYFGVTQIAWTPGGFDNPSLPYRGVLVETYRSRDGLLQSVVGAFDEKRGFQHFVGTLGRTGQGTMFRNGGREARPMFGQITGLAMAENGTVYVADETNEMIRRVTPDGTVSTLAGLEPVPGAPRASIDGPATTARFASLSGMALDPATGDLYVADAFKIRRVTQAGVVTTLYDDGRPGTRVKVFFDWGMVPSSRALPGLKGLADHAVLRFFNGNLFVLDKTSSRITVCRLADRTCRALVGAGHPAMARLNRPLPYFSPGLDEQEYTQLRNASDMIITPTGKCVVTLDYGIVQLDLGALGDPAAAAPAPAAGAGAAAAPAAPVPPAGAGAGAAPERESKDEVPRL